jgi:hypothetical protein
VSFLSQLRQISLKQSINPFHLTRGLGFLGTVEMILDSQNLSDPLGDFSSEDEPIFTLESLGKSKSRDNLIN